MGSQYTNFQCDVRFAPGSATVTVGGVPIFGHLQFGIPTRLQPGLFWRQLTIPASNTNWVHVSHPPQRGEPIPICMNIYDVLIHIYGPYYSPGLSGTSTLWVDNIKFVGASSSHHQLRGELERRASKN